MNKRIGTAILTAVLTMALVPAAAFAYTGEEGSSSETGVIVREIPAEEVDETEETSSDFGTAVTGTTSTGSSDQSGDIRNEDGSVTQSSSTNSGTGSSSAGTAGIGNIEDLLSSLSEGTTTTEEKKIGTVTTDGSYLNVRSGEGLDYGVIDTLNNGDTVEVLEDHGDWLYVSIPEHTGYVCADYMDVRTVPVEVQQDGSLSISLDPELIRQMLEQAEEEGGEVTSTDLGLTPEGNLTLVDDYGNAGTTGKQFITMATKSGNIFYLIIDRDDEGNETVHFLNQVDENDLFALMDEKEVTEMKEQIAAEEAAKEAEEAAEKAKEEEAAQTPTPEVEPEKEKSGANPFLLALPLLLVFGGIGGYLYLKTKRKQNSSAGQDPDAGYLDDDDDLDIYELPEEPEVKKEPVSEDDPDYWLDEEDDE
ncbi:MAG: DUF4366 domain-containing protein [Oscillospiraceae bacterium]|nr:DUF4366 domain-containing protein [Oscillospiraceae bacterium]